MEENNEKEEQRAGRNKSTQIVKAYINGSEFRRKFDLITASKDVNRLLYQVAKKMLFHRTGTEYEDMYWIDPIQCRIVAKEINEQEEQTISYSDAIKTIIIANPGLITIHSHPEGTPPSIDDLNSNYVNKYSLGIVVGHGGQIYIYSSNEYINPIYFEISVAEYIQQGYNESEARVKAIESCMQTNDIYFEEVR
ncbi:hypothetical protein [Butyrivibrio sp. WCD3002]|uniref:hypothetical protein n=1 Tax=Butyrivibrio sp. WCD3002 TaxID=1280676 RepID=UPI0004124CC3|nr:hypothetical protein [Butyrivibrio sp. WCD3002]